MTITYVQPSAGTRPYLPDLYHQIDGTAFQQSNCVPSTATMLVDRSSVGKWRVSGSRFRTLSGDTSGGMTYSQVAPAVRSATSGEVVATVVTTDRAGLKSLVAAGRSVGVSIACSVTINTPYHTGSYAGGHSIYVQAWRYNAALARDEFLVGDPGRGTETNDTGYVWWPAWLLYKAAEARGAVFLLVGPDTEGVSRVAASPGTVWSSASKSSTAKATFSTGKALTIVSTQNGGPWAIDGHSGDGWHKVKWGTGYGYVVGARLKTA